MSETEESANLAASVEASDEPTVSTTPSSSGNDESAAAQDARSSVVADKANDANVADDNALQIPSAGLRVTSTVEAAPSRSPAADLSSDERQNAPTKPANKNLMIDFPTFLNEYDYPKFFCSLVNYGMLQPCPSNEVQE